MAAAGPRLVLCGRKVSVRLGAACRRRRGRLGPPPPGGAAFCGVPRRGPRLPWAAWAGGALPVTGPRAVPSLRPGPPRGVEGGAERGLIGRRGFGGVFPRGRTALSRVRGGAGTAGAVCRSWGEMPRKSLGKPRSVKRRGMGDAGERAGEAAGPGWLRIRAGSGCSWNRHRCGSAPRGASCSAAPARSQARCGARNRLRSQARCLPGPLRLDCRRAAPAGAGDGAGPLLAEKETFFAQGSRGSER